MRQRVPFLRRSLAAVAASVALAVTAAIGPAARTASAAPTLVDLASPDQLRAAFNRDVGKTRIILLVSPT